MIYTIGYQGIALDPLKEIMDEKKIDLLINCAASPIRGTPSSTAAASRPISEIACLERKPSRRPLRPGKGRRHRLSGRTPPGKTYLLMCMEKDPRQCHRFYDMGSRLLDRGIDIAHLVERRRLGLRTTSELKRQTLQGPAPRCDTGKGDILSTPSLGQHQSKR